MLGRDSARGIGRGEWIVGRRLREGIVDEVWFSGGGGGGGCCRGGLEGLGRHLE